MTDEEAQTAMLTEVLRGFDANTPASVFHVADRHTEAIAEGLVTALKYHGWVLRYHPEITAANLDKIIAENPVTPTNTVYEPERLSES